MKRRPQTPPFFSAPSPPPSGGQGRGEGASTAGHANIKAPAPRPRHALLRSTALQATALALGLPALAQPAPGAHPTGGHVVAGQASITNGANTTLINQASRSTSIDWQSFSIGANQSVVFRQPGPTAIALNRVIGSDPSVIAGRITANGQVVLVNQSGVLFTQGSQVDTAGLVVSAAGMPDRNFANGRLVFDQAPHPGATISNAGNITVRQAGLAALVAPQVANSGLITAKLGHVVLAGGEAFTLDLYGDRLVSLNVTSAVRAVSIGGRTLPALVTNTGTVLAPGGTILLTARQADALVTSLVSAGGTLAADTLGARRGEVLVEGVGGSVEIAGTLSAQGTAPGTAGGTIGVDATNTVTLGRSAVVDASGAAGGGTIALGTTLTRARSGHGVPATGAARVAIARGAAIRADATSSGAGGRIAVLGRQSVIQDGAISARGGSVQGDGGSIELSGLGTLAITGTENASTAHGLPGSITIDPALVEITDGTADTGYTKITTATVDGMSGNVTLTATDTLKLLSDVTLGSGATGFNLNAGTLLVLSAAFNAGTLAGTFASGTGGIQQTAGLVTAGTLDLEATGSVAQTGGGIAAGTLLGAVHDASLTGANTIGTLGALTVSTGDFALATGGTLQVTGPLATLPAGAVTLTATSIGLTSAITTGTLDLVATAGDITQTAAGAISATNLAASATAGGTLTGQILLNAASNTVTTLGSASADGGLYLVDTRALGVTGAVSAGPQLVLISSALTLAAASHLGVAANGLVSLNADAFTLAGSTITATGGTVAFDRVTVGTLTTGTGGTLPAVLGSIAAGTLALGSADGVTGDSTHVTAITIGGALDASGIAPVLALFSGGTLSGASPITATTLRADAGTIALSGGNAVGTATLLTSGGAILFDDAHALVIETSSAGTGAVTIGVSGTSNSLTLAGTLTSAGASLSAASGSVVEAGGVLHLGSGTLSVTAGAGVSLESSGNSFSTLGTGAAGSGAFTLTDGEALTVAAGISAGPSLVLASTALTLATGSTLAVAANGLVSLNADGFTTSGATITASGGTVAFDRVSPGTLNVAAGGTLDPAALGTITAGTLALGSADGITGDSANTTALTIGNALDASGIAPVLTLFSGGTLSGDSPITVTTLRASAGTIALSGSNAVGTAALASSGGDILFDDAHALVLATSSAGTGAVTIGVTGASNNLTLAGTLTSASASLSAASGSITEAGGAIHLGTGSLSATSGTGVTLTSTANSVSTLGTGDGGTGAFVLTTGTGLTVATGISAGPSIALTSTALTLSSGSSLGVSAAGLVSLASDSFALSGSTITAPGGIVALDRATSGTFLVAGGGTLDPALLGSIAAGTLALGSRNGVTAGTQSTALRINGTLDATGFAPVLALFGGANLSGSGAIEAGTLVAAAGAIDLEGSNAVGTLARLAATGDIVFDDSHALVTTGPVTSASGNVTLRVSGAGHDLSIGSTLTGASVVFGAASGAVIETSGATLSAATLTASAGTSLALDGSANLVGTLGGLIADGDIAFSDGQALTVDGFVSSASGAVSLQVTGAAQNLTISSGITAATTLALNATGNLAIGAILSADGASLTALGGITEAGGALHLGAGSLSATAGTGIALDSSGNTVSTLGTAEAGTGAFLLSDTTDLTVANGISAGPSIALVSTTLTLASGSTLAVADGGLISLAADGYVLAGSTIAAADGRVALDRVTPGTLALGTGETIDPAALGSITTGTLTLGSRDGVTPGTNVTAITIDSGFDVTGIASVLSLFGGTSLTGAGPVSVATLTAQAGSITLDGSNQVGTIAALAATGDIVFGDAHRLVVAGAITSASGDVSLTVTGTANNLLIDASIGGRQIALAADGSIDQADAAPMTAGTLTASVGTSLSLASPSNSVGTLAGLSATDAIVFQDARTLAVAGLVRSTAGDVSLTVLGGSHDLDIGARIDADGALALQAAGSIAIGAHVSGDGAVIGAGGSITEAGGTITLGAGFLSATAGAGITLDSNRNSFTTIGASNSGTGSFALTDAAALTVAGHLQATGDLSLSVIGAGNDLTLAANLSSDAVTLGVAGGNVIEQPAAGILSGTLAASSSGSLDLASAANRVGTLAALSAGTIIDIVDPVSVTLTADIGAGGAITLEANRVTQAAGTISTESALDITADTGGIALSGGLTDAAGPTTLAALGGDVATSAGAMLNIGTLSGSASGALDLSAGTIHLGTLTGFAAGTTLTVADLDALAIAGQVTAATQAIVSAPELDFPGTLALSGAGLISLAADRFVFDGKVATPSGTIALTRLTAGTFSVGPAAGSTADTLAGLRVGPGTVVIGSLDGATSDPTTTAIALTAPAAFDGSDNTARTLVLLSPGDIASSGGLTVSTLTATSSSGGIVLTGPNAIPVLGPVAAAGRVIVTDTTGLELTSDVTGPTGVTLSAAGSLAVDAGISVTGTNVSLAGSAIGLAGTLAAQTGTVTLAAAGAITETGSGNIQADTLAGPAVGGTLHDGTLTLLSASNAIGVLGGLSGAGGLFLNDSTPLTIAGPAALAGQVSLTVTGGTHGITATGSLSAGTGLVLTAPGAVVQTAGLLSSGTSLSVDAASLAFAGTLHAGGTASLTVPGSIVENAGGKLASGTLAGSAGGSILLANAQNAVSRLGSLTAGGSLSLSDATTLTIAGPVHSTGGDVSIADAQGVFIAGDLSGATISLVAGGGIAELSTGSIEAALLTGSAGNNALFDGTNHVASLGPFAAGGDLTFDDAETLDIVGALTAGGQIDLNLQGDLILSADFRSAGNIALSAGNITQLSGTIATPGALTLAAQTGTVAFGGQLSGNAVTLTAIGEITETLAGAPAPTGALIATSLTGTTGGEALFTTPNTATLHNRVGTLAGFVTTHGLSLVDASPLATTGTVSGTDGTIALAAPTMTLLGTLADASVLLTAGAGGIDASGGAVDATFLSGRSGGAALFTGANQVGTLTGFAAATVFDLQTAGTLAVTGAVGAPQSVVLGAAGDLAFGAAITSQSVLLTASGAISETLPGSTSLLGRLVAGTLAGSAGGTVALDGANQVGTVAGFAAGPGFTLADGTDLSVTGTVSSTGLLSLTAPGLTLASTLADSTGTVSLAIGADGITGTAGGIGAATLTGSSAGTVLLDGANQVATLGGFSAIGAFTLADDTALLLAGPLAAPTVALNAAGAIDEAASGSIATTLLAVSSAGSVQLGAANAVGTVTSLSSGGLLLLNDTGPLALAGTISAAADTTLTIAGSLTQLSGALDSAGPLAISAASMEFGGLVQAPGLVTLVASAGDIAETGAGALVAGTLSGSTPGSLHLDAASGNAIGTLANFAAGGDLTLTDDLAPTLAGIVAAGRDVALTVTPGATGTLTLAGTLTAPRVFSITTPGDVAQPSGGVSAGTLTASVGGSLALGGPANTLTLLGPIAAGTGLTLADAIAINLAGPVSAGGDAALSSAGSIGLAGSLTDTAGLTTLIASGGDITTSAGATLNLAALSGSATGALNLSAGSIHVGTLANFASGGTLAVTDLDRLTIAGQVTAAGQVTVLAPELDVSGRLALGGAGLISLAADRFVFGGQVATAGGTIALSRLTAGVFSVAPGGTADTLAGLQTGQGTGLVTIGSRDGVTADPATTAISLLAPVTFDGTTNSTGTLSLLAPGDIAATGPITAPILTATSSAGNIGLTGPNVVPVFGVISAAGSVTILDTSGVALTADITGPAGVTLVADGLATVQAGVTVSGADIFLYGGGVDIAGLLSAPTGIVNLGGSGPVTELGGTILAGTLRGPSAGGPFPTGTLTLLSASNVIGTLGDLASTGDLSLQDSAPLTIAGLVQVAGHVALTVEGGITSTGDLSAGNGLSLSAAGGMVQTAGTLASIGDLSVTAQNLTFGGTIRASATTAFQVSGDVAEAPGGTLETDTLAGAAGGAISIASASNAIGTLGDIAAPGSIAIADQISATLSGTVASGGSDVSISDAAFLTLAGTVSGGTVSLLSDGGIAQLESGTIGAGLLTGSSSGDIALVGANQIARLGPLAAGGSLTLADLASLTVVAPLGAGGPLAVTVQGDLTLASDIAGSSVALTSTGLFSQQTGAVRAPGAIQIAASQIVQASAGVIASDTAIDIAATSGDIALAGQVASPAGEVRLTATGSIADTGSLTVALLSGQAGGNAIFGAAPGSAASVATLGTFSSGGAFTLADSTDLAVAGPVSAGTTLNLSVGGAGTGMALAGDLSAPAIVLSAPQDIFQNAGAIQGAATARLDAAGTISLAGTLSAPSILVGSIVAPTLVEWNGNTIITSSDLVRGEKIFAPPVADGSRPGIFVHAGGLVQTGTTLINPAGGPATLEILLTGPGKVTLDPSLAAGLVGPGTFAFFSLGGGTASGNIDLGSLDVEYANAGATNPTQFTGVINGVGGAPAAGFGTIGPRPNQEYQINGCPIASTNCILLSPLVVPVQNPVLEVSFDPPRRRREDDELVLPNVADQDY